LIRAAALAALALVLMQGLALPHVELTFDEAYYALWARWPQAGYYDHPPLVAWVISASEKLFGGGEFGVRALFWAMGAALPALTFWIGARLYDARTGAAAALILVGAPLMAGTPLATPDTPLAFFWALALAGLAEVFRGRSWGWAFLGLATGAAGLAKLTAGFLAIGVALAVIATPSLRAHLRRPGPWAAAALALVVVSPFLWWNATHGWATLVKQGGRVAAHGFAPRYLGEFLGAQLLLFNPITVFAVAGRVRGAPSAPTRLLLATVAPALAYFLIHALHDRVQGNWPAPLYPALAILAGRALAGTRWPAAAAAAGLATAAAAYLHLALAWPDLGPRDPTLRVGGWRELAAQVRAHPASYIRSDGYAVTSLLAFYGAGAPVIEAGEPERWGFRPPVDASGPGLAFRALAPGVSASRPTCCGHDVGLEADAPVGREPTGSPLAILTRRVGGRALESYGLFSIPR
jgi:hypothetical protein